MSLATLEQIGGFYHVAAAAGVEAHCGTGLGQALAQMLAEDEDGYAFDRIVGPKRLGELVAEILVGADALVKSPRLILVERITPSGAERVCADAIGRHPRLSRVFGQDLASHVALSLMRGIDPNAEEALRERVHVARLGEEAGVSIQLESGGETLIGHFGYVGRDYAFMLTFKPDALPLTGLLALDGMTNLAAPQQTILAELEREGASIH